MKLNKIFAMLAIATMASCTLVDMEDAPKGNISLTTDWTNRTSGIVQPANYEVVINNRILTFNNITNRLPDLEAGIYPVYVYNTPDKISIDGNSATVSTENNIVDPLPGWLFTAITEAVYADLKEETIIAVMQQQIKQLTIILKPQGSTAQKITSITAHLSGVAATWNFKTNQPAKNAVNVPLNFIKQTDGTWQVSIRLLGVIGNVQKLSGLITFRNSSLEDIPVQSNLSVELSAFNTEKAKPLSLSGNIEIPTETGFTATISHWTENNGGTVIAN